MFRQFIEHLRYYLVLKAVTRKTPLDPQTLQVPRQRKVTTTDYHDPDLKEIVERGRRKAYVVLDKSVPLDFVRPVRYTYVHLTCGQPTSMFHEIAETYARDPKFYTHTYCATCQDHFPVGKDGEFVWDGTEEKVGT